MNIKLLQQLLTPPDEKDNSDSEDEHLPSTGIHKFGMSETCVTQIAYLIYDFRTVIRARQHWRPFSTGYGRTISHNFIYFIIFELQKCLRKNCRSSCSINRRMARATGTRGHQCVGLAQTTLLHDCLQANGDYAGCFLTGKTIYSLIKSNY